MFSLDLAVQAVPARALQGVAFAGKSLQLKTMAGLHTVSIPIEEDEGKPLEIT